jgi:hypothetical protein
MVPPGPASCLKAALGYDVAFIWSINPFTEREVHMLVQPLAWPQGYVTAGCEGTVSFTDRKRIPGVC